MVDVVIAIVVVGSLAIAWSSLAPWVPTQIADLERVNKLSGLKKGDVFVEIGCGNGRVCSYIARHNVDAKVVGIELAFPFYVFTKLRSWIFGPRNMKIVFGNALRKDLTSADVVYVFGLRDTVNGKLKSKIEKELKKGARFISYVFKVSNWKGETKSVKVDGGAEIFVYEKCFMKSFFR